MIRLYIVCEGQTEETFVNEILSTVLHPCGVYPKACLLGPAGAKGGTVNYARVSSDVLKFLKQDLGGFCTTFLDYYGIDSDFPGRKASAGATTSQKAQIIHEEFRKAICQQLPERFRPDRFIPYIQMYEFEGLLFSDPRALAKGLYQEKIESKLVDIRRQFPTPEDINDGPMTAPSKRIGSLFQGYEKPILGTLAAIEIGLDAIRQECKLFNQWIERLMRIGEPESPTA